MLKKKITPLIIMALSLISFIASIILTFEKIEVWKDPNYVTACSWNPVFSCQGPITSWQSSVFVLPNPIIGILGFGLLLALTGMTLFIDLPKWWYKFWVAGTTVSVVFIGWLISQSLYDINALCIYCMCVWACVIAIAWLSWKEYANRFHEGTTFSYMMNNLVIPGILVCYLTIATMIYFQFQDFFNMMLGI